MTELELSLAALASEVDWPSTPTFALPHVLPRRSRRRLVIAVALAALVVAVGAAFAVPSARSAILRLFGFGGVTIERVATLPSAQERPLAATLGTPVSRESAESVLGGALRLPAIHGDARLYRNGSVISALFASPAPTLLSEFRSGPDSGLLKKLVGDSTGVRFVQVTATAQGVWISGEEHLFVVPGAPPRLAGNVLLWHSGEVTYRLEGRELTEETALRLAREIDGT